MKHNFDIVTSERSLGTAYDYNSIMHYPEHAFGPNRQITMKSKTQTKILPSKRLTPTDIKEIRTLYNCGQESLHKLVFII